MKILQINTVYKNGGSTGRIVYDISEMLKKNNIDSYVAFGYEYSLTSDEKTFRMESIPVLKWTILKTRLFARHGFYNKKETVQLVKWIDAIKPDVIHLHNLHNHYMNVEILFDYIKKNNIPVVWTLHDCWPFTGWCAYFDMASCDKWKTSCHNCPSKKSYPKTWFFDRSEQNFADKKRVFSGVERLTIVTPSKWLGDLVQESFLKEYPVVVIHNGIDLSNFSCKKSEIEKRDSVRLLGVADKWGKRKGLAYFYDLRKALPENYEITLIGLSPKQIEELPKGITGITRTDSLKELVSYYQWADIFVNPTLEDNFPTTNIEALACGTPVITFQTGGSPESLNDKVGKVVKRGDSDALIQAVIEMESSLPTPNECYEHAKRYFNKFDRYADYINLYKEILGG